MTKNPHLDDAVAIFEEVGWAGADLADAPTLPIGTAEQQRKALAGLRSGDFEKTQVHASPTGGTVVTGVPVLDHADLEMLGLFAVRVGITARRAVAVLLDTLGPEAMGTAVPASVVAGRGEDYAQKFVDAVVTSAGWRAQSLGLLLVRLVADLGLPIPGLREYAESWAGAAFAALWARTGPGDDLAEALTAEQRTWAGIVEHGGRWAVLTDPADRFAEHVRAGVAAGVTGTGVFGWVVPAGVAHGWMGRDEAAALVVTALDQATRPTDCVAWLRVWLDRLGATSDEILAQAEILVPVLAASTGHTLGSEVVERLAPPLIAGVGDDLLVDVATAALGVSTKKARWSVLAALAVRPRPSDTTVEAIAPQVTVLEGAGFDKVVAAVVRAWGLAETPGLEPAQN